jgi:hypothetical protein
MSYLRCCFCDGDRVAPLLGPGRRPQLAASVNISFDDAVPFGMHISEVTGGGQALFVIFNIWGRFSINIKSCFEQDSRSMNPSPCVPSFPIFGDRSHIQGRSLIHFAQSTTLSHDKRQLREFSPDINSSERSHICPGPITRVAGACPSSP